MPSVNHASGSVENLVTVKSNECQAISSHLPLEYLISSLLRLTSNEMLNICTTGPSCWQPLVTGGLASQWTSKAENVSM